MKIDIVGQWQRGLAMGLNEFSGYLSAALVAFFNRDFSRFTWITNAGAGNRYAHSLLSAAVIMVRMNAERQEKTANVEKQLEA